MSAGRVRRWLRRIAIGLGAFVLLLVLLWIFRFPLFGGLLRRTIGDALAQDGIRLSVRDISGSLLSNAELTGVRLTDSSGLPMLEKASVDRVAVSFSLPGLLRGRDDWIRTVEIEGLTGVLDLDAPPGPKREPSPPSAGGGTVPLPGRVSLTDLNLTVKHGEDRLEIREARLVARRGEGDTYRGEIGAALARAVVEREEHRGEGIRAGIAWRDGVLTVDPLEINGQNHGRVLVADLSKAAQARYGLDLDLPLFGGSIRIAGTADLSGAHPRADADIAIRSLDPRPILRFVPGLPPVDLSGIEGTLHAHLPGGAAPDLEQIDTDFDLTIRDPAYDGRPVDRLSVRGTMKGGKIDAAGEVVNPDTRFSAKVDLTGEVPVLDARAEVENADLTRLELEPGGRALGGVASVSARARGPTDHLDLYAKVGVARPVFGRFGADRLDLTASGTPEDIRLSTLALRRGGDAVDVKDARLRPSAEPLTFSGSLEVRVADLARYRSWLPPGLPEDLAGALRIDARVDGDTNAPGAELTLTGTGLVAAGLSAKSLAVTARIPAADHFVVSRLAVEGAGDLPDAVLTGLDLRLGENGTEILIGGLTATRGGREVRAPEPGHVAIEGENLKVSLPLAAEGARLTVNAEMGAGHALSGTVGLDAVDLGRLSRIFSLPVGLEGEATGTIQLGGTTDEPMAVLALNVPGFTAQLPDRPAIRTGALTVRARLAEGIARLSSLEITGPGAPASAWKVLARGEIALASLDPGPAPIRGGRIQITDLPLDAAGPLPGIGAIAGVLRADFDVAGTLDAPEATGRLDIESRDLHLGGNAVPAFKRVAVSVRTAALSPAGGRLELTVSADAPGAKIAVDLSSGFDGRGPVSPTGTVKVQNMDLATLLHPLLPGVETGGHANLDVALREDGSLAVDLEGKLLRYGALDLGRLDFAAAWAGGTFRVTRGSLVAPTGTIEFGGSFPLELDLAGLTARVDPAARPDLFVRPDIDLGIVDLRRAGVRVSGRIRGEIRSAGTFRAPDARGAVEIEHLFARAVGAPPIDDFGGTIRIDEDRIVFEKLEGSVGRGHLALDGSVARNGFAIGPIDIDVNGQNVLLVRDRSMTFRADLNCRLTGDYLTGMKLAGRLDVRSLRYSSNVDYLSTQPSLAPLPLTDDPVLGRLELALVVQAPPDSIRIRTNVLDGDLSGRFEVGGTVAVPRPDGRVMITNGFAKLPTTTLKVEKGSVAFRAEQPLRPYVDAQLTSTISGTEIRTHVSGPANRLQIDLSSTPPMPQPDLLSMLVTGVPRGQLGADTLGSVAATLVYRQLTAELAGNGNGEESGLSKLAKRVEVEVDTNSTAGGGVPTWSATVKLVDDWLLLRGGQDDPVNYGVDLIFRLSFK